MPVRWPIIARAVVAAAVLVPTWGCVPPVTITSQPGPQAGPVAESLFIVLDVPGIDARTRYVAVPGAEFGVGEADTMTFGSRFLQELGTQLDAVGVGHRDHVPVGAGRTRDEIVRQAQGSGAGAILWIFGKLVGVRMVESGTRPASTRVEERFGLEATVLPVPSTGEPLWTGTIEADVVVESWRAFAPQMASVLVDRLVADGVIGAGTAE